MIVVKLPIRRSGVSGKEEEKEGKKEKKEGKEEIKGEGEKYMSYSILSTYCVYIHYTLYTLL